jgi:hypothetical protein
MIVSQNQSTSIINKTKPGLRIAGMMALFALPSLWAMQVRLTWNPNPESDIAGYVVNYGTQGGNLTQLQTTGAVTSATISGLSPSTTYYFTLQAYNTAGLHSDPTSPVSHSTPAPGPTGLELRDADGAVMTGDGGLIDLGMVRIGGSGAGPSFTLVNHGPESVSGLRWYLENSAAGIVEFAGMPVLALANENGSFERSLHGWSASGQVRARASSDATHGAELVDFSFDDGANDGRLSTSFATVAGKSYRLEFDLGLRCDNTNSQSMRTTLQGAGMLVSNVSSISGPGGGMVLWRPESHDFIADSAVTTLVFEDVSSTTTGLELLLDHVRVIDLAASDAGEGITLAPGASVDIAISYKPVTAGFWSAHSRLLQAGGTQDVYDFLLRGYGSISYQAWLAAMSQQDLAASALDPLHQFAFGMDPGVPAGGVVSFVDGRVVSRGAPAVLPPGGPDDVMHGVFARRRDHTIAGLIYRPQFSSDLIDWHDAVAEPAILADDGEIEVLAVGAPDALSGMSARFFRVGVDSVPDT